MEKEKNKIYLTSNIINKYYQESNGNWFCFCFSFRLFVITVIPFYGKLEFWGKKTLMDQKLPLFLDSNEY